MYWYSCPPLLKQWIDIVLEHGWAYGKEGYALKDKLLLQAITTGGKKENYCATGRDMYTVPQLLEPFRQTARVCRMEYLPPFVVHGTHAMDDEGYADHAKLYGELLTHIAQTPLSAPDIQKHLYANDWFINTTANNGE